MILYVKATPNARKSEIVGWEEDPMRGRILRTRIAAPPVEGKANSELRSFLAGWLGIPKCRAILEKGDTSRIKAFSIPDRITTSRDPREISPITEIWSRRCQRDTAASMR